MALHRPRYYVEYDPTAAPVVVEVSSGDMMRAELEAKRLALPPAMPFHTTALWLWSGLVRMGLEERKAGEFIADPPEFDPIKNAAGEPDTAEVGPTRAGPGVPASGSPPVTVT